MPRAFGAQPAQDGAKRLKVVQMNHGDLRNQKSGVFAKVFFG